MTSCAQADRSVIPVIAPNVYTYSFSLGNKTIRINKSIYDGYDNGLVFVQLHHNEKTAELAARTYLQQNGGILLSIDNKGERNISFRLHGKLYTFDPNRMFTRAGIRTSLQLYGRYSIEAENLINEFALFVLSSIPEDLPLIAVHNNTDKNYSVQSYLYDAAYRKEAQEVITHKSEDVDNFFINTDSHLHAFLTAQNFNSILLNPSGKDDGSLSYYYSKRQKPYINIEAQEGHLSQQIKMVETVGAALK